MGLFSSKTIVCENCGNEYQARIQIGEHLCPICAARIKDKKKSLQGYVEYAFDMDLEKYSEEQLDSIAKHRDSVLEKYRVTQGISAKELEESSKNYKNLTDEEAQAILSRTANSMVSKTIGASYANAFFIPTKYPKVIVDADDVFAVGYVSDYKLRTMTEESILCAVFTNDPFVPVFPMVYGGALKLTELLKSKGGRAATELEFSIRCHNLTYPVQELKTLKKQIKGDGCVKGNINLDYMLLKMQDASYSSGCFNTKDMESELDPDTISMLESYGYLEDTKIDNLLSCGGFFAKAFWEKQAKKMTKSTYGE